MHRMYEVLVGAALTVALTGVGAACTPEASPVATPTRAPAASPTPASVEDLKGGVLATFDVQGATFRAFVTRASTIQQLLALQAKDSFATIPNGALVRGPGPGRYNAPWSWHLDPTDVEMAVFTMEVCDGTPDAVEREIDHWVDTVKRYCPWSARLIDLQDYR